MLKKSRIIAAVSVCVMVLGVVQPVFAWGNRTGSRKGDAALYGSIGGILAAGLFTFITAGAGAPLLATAVAGTVGAGGAGYYGYKVENKSFGKDVAVIAGSAVGGTLAGGAAGLVIETVAGSSTATSGASYAAKETVKKTTKEVAKDKAKKGMGGMASSALLLNGRDKTPTPPKSPTPPKNPHLPRDGSGGNWSGERGNSDWVMDKNATPANKLYNSEKLTWNEINAKYRNNIKSIPFKNGEPDFSAVAVDTVKINNFTSSRFDNFRQADQNFADKLNKANGLNLSANDIEKFRLDNNLTWHERSDMGTLDLIPREYHSIPHSGGISNAK